MLRCSLTPELATRHSRNIEKVLAEKPDDPDAIYGAGLALFATGNEAKYKEAANYLQRFVDKAPDGHKDKEATKAVLAELKNTANVVPEKTTPALAVGDLNSKFDRKRGRTGNTISVRPLVCLLTRTSIGCRHCGTQSTNFEEISVHNRPSHPFSSDHESGLTVTLILKENSP